MGQTQGALRAAIAAAAGRGEVTWTRVREHEAVKRWQISFLPKVLPPLSLKKKKKKYYLNAS